MVDGTIADAGPLSEIQARHPAGAVTDLGRRAMLPGTVNAHNHSFQSLLRGIGDDQPFLVWRDRALYKYGPRLGADGVYVGALFAFAEMLLHGVTAVCDFFYVNDDGNDNAEAVIRAAERVGIRLVLARCFYDWDGAPTAFRETIPDAESRFLAAASPLPAASDRFGHSGAAFAARSVGGDDSRRRGVRAPSRGCPGTSTWPRSSTRSRRPSSATERPRSAPSTKWVYSMTDMVAVHGCWFDAGERALMAERGAGLAYNPNSNMFLGDGVTDIVDLVARGVKIALGTDGGCSNSRVSVFDEMRACALLQKVTRLDGQAITAEQCFAMGTVGGGQLLGLPIGRLAIGQRADVTFVDLDDPSLWPEPMLVKNVVYALSARAITDVFVAGLPVVRACVPVKVALSEVRDEVRRLTRGWSS